MKNKLLLSLLIFVLCGCREVIVHNLSETEANKMLTQLVVSQLDVRKERQADGKWSLSLPSEQSSQAIRYLSDNRLLKDESSSLPEKAGLMQSKEEQRFRYERALSHEIEATLSGLNGVLQARVHLNLPLLDPFFGQNIDNSKSSASILLVMGAQAIDKSEVSALVAGASGIPIASISVMLSSAIIKDDKSQNIQVADLPAEELKVQSAKVFASDRVSTEQISPNYSSLVNLLSKSKIFLASLPWSLIGMGVAICLIFIGALRFMNRHEKIVI